MFIGKKNSKITLILVYKSKCKMNVMSNSRKGKLNGCFKWRIYRFKTYRRVRPPCISWKQVLKIICTIHIDYKRSHFTDNL